jgi:hypothetical protein
MALAIGGIINCSQSNMGLGVTQVGVPVSLLFKPQQFLNLEGGGDLGLVSTATSLFVSVSGCASGYTVGSGASPTAITTVVNLYKGDRGCLVKLEKFTLGSATYSSQGANAVAFSSFAAGGVATFQDTVTASSIIKVFVNTQVESPLTGSSTVVYNFTDIQAGTTNTISQANVSTPVPLSATGQEAPNYTMPHARYLSTNVDGSGNLSFTLACGATVSGTGVTETCSGINLTTQLDYKLVENTYSGTLTVAQANTIFSTAGTAITADGTGGTGTTIAAAGSDANSNTITNGGFYTSNGTPLVTTAAFYPDHLSYIFVLRQRDTTGAQNTLSYLYIVVTLTNITQS